MKVYDCFTFNGEYDILEVRLNILNDYVDYFILSESGWTFRGNSKPRYYEEAKDRYREFWPKIRCIDVPYLETDDPWLRENQQRDYLRDGLFDAEPDDLIILSDVDEIWNPAYLSELIDKTKKTDFVRFTMRAYFYTLYWYFRRYNCARARGTRFRHISSSMSDLANRGGIDVVVADAGWHLTYFGGPEKVYEKLKSFSHSELDDGSLDYEYCAKLIREGLDVVPDRWAVEKVEINTANHPAWLIDNLDRYPIFLNGGLEN